jgi:hypothetical protein
MNLRKEGGRSGAQCYQYGLTLAYVEQQNSDIIVAGLGFHGGIRMLCSLSKQISHCYFRAAECRERAARCVSPTDREYYIEREQAWLTLARSYEFQERLTRMVTELSRNQWHGGLPPEQNRWIAPPQCPSCGIEMQFQLRRPDKNKFVQKPLSFERALFVCTNCSRLDEQLVATSSY